MIKRHYKIMFKHMVRHYFFNNYIHIDIESNTSFIVLVSIEIRENLLWSQKLNC